MLDSVLELSKWLMYDFHYNFIKTHFDAELLFTDTGSYTYKIKSEDAYEEFFKHKHLFDFTNYPKDSKFFNPTNKKVIGKMKDEKEGKINDEFFGLKSKTFLIKNIDGKESKTAKGVNIAIEFSEFKDTLFNKKIMRHKMKIIQSKKHKLETYEITKSHYRVLMINDTFKMIVLIHLHIFTKTKILKDEKSSHKWSQRFSRIVINDHK